MKYTVDAKNKSFGRVASEAARLLMGKDTVVFAKNVVADVSVSIVNAKSAKIDQKKLTEKKYARYSGYPGGLTMTTLDKTLVDKGVTEVFRKAVYGMLPGNKLRPLRMKRLIIVE